MVGAVVAFINPRFLSPINLANTANLVGLFGLFSIGEGFVIITGGIELSVGSMIALLGVIFVDLIVDLSACRGRSPCSIIVARRHRARLRPWLARSRKLKLQPFIVTLCGLLIYRGVARCYTDDGTAGFAFGQSFPALEWLTTGPHLRRAASPSSSSLIVAAIMWVVLHRSVFGRYLFAGRQERGGGALFRHPHQPGHRRRLRHLRRAGRPVVDLPRHVHALDLARVARQFLRALRASPPRCSAAARCAAAKARSSASCSARSCCRCCRTSSICSASRARSISR